MQNVDCPPHSPTARGERPNTSGGSRGVTSSLGRSVADQIISPRASAPAADAAFTASPRDTSEDMLQASSPSSAFGAGHQQQMGSSVGSTAMMTSKSSEPEPKFDMLRLREWFNAMDLDRSGHVQKKQFLEFVQSNPLLRKVLLRGDTDVGSHQDQRRQEALSLRKLLRVWKEIDEDKNGTLEWEEFVECFRRGGWLIEYATQDNPKDRLAAILQGMQDGSLEQDPADLEEFMQLKSKHVPGERRASLGKQEAMDALDTLQMQAVKTGPAGPVTASDGGGAAIERRRNSLQQIAYSSKAKA